MSRPETSSSDTQARISLVAFTRQSQIAQRKAKNWGHRAVDNPDFQEDDSYFQSAQKLFSAVKNEGSELVRSNVAEIKSDVAVKSLDKSEGKLMEAVTCFNEHLKNGRKAAQANSEMVIKWLQETKKDMYPMLCVFELRPFFKQLLPSKLIYPNHS
jgi:hypothetical protein